MPCLPGCLVNNNFISDRSRGYTFVLVLYSVLNYTATTTATDSRDRQTAKDGNTLAKSNYSRDAGCTQHGMSVNTSSLYTAAEAGVRTIFRIILTQLYAPLHWHTLVVLSVRRRQHFAI